jgi:N-acylneuraminate cytidylyltransferase
MNNLAIIPARGGSKRIPRKNIKNFLGKPIIAYSIENALNSGLFQEVMVSTDDQEIAEIAIKYGAKIPFFRSKEKSDDTTTTLEVLKEVFSNYIKLGIEYENICCIYPCAPLCNSSHLVKAFELFNLNDFETLFPVLPYSSPIQRALRIKNNKIKMIDTKFESIRTQDLEPSYHDAGQFYWINSKSFFERKQIISQNSGVIILNEMEVQDIDNEMDWKLAELKYTFLNKNNGN